MRIDAHCHLTDDPQVLEEIVESQRRAGFDKVCLSTPRSWAGFATNEQVLEAARRAPEMIVPLARFRLGQAKPEDLRRFRDEGFLGFKTINPLSNYDDRVFYDVYEEAEKLGLPILFHTGIIARTSQDRQFDVDSGRMRPIYLDTVARHFQGLPIIVAHFGNPWSDELAMSLRWHPNLYADWSGSLLEYRPHAYLRELLWWGENPMYEAPDGKRPLEKIVFGSDVSPARLAMVVERYDSVLDAFDASDDERAAVFGKTAAQLFGLEDAKP